MSFEKVKQLLRNELTTKILLILVLLLAAPYLLRLLDFEALVGKRPVAKDLTSLGQPLGVKALIRAVKKELYEADRERIEKDEAALFRVENFELEINFIVSNRTKGSAELGPQFIVVNKEMDIASERVQKIKLFITVNREQERKGKIATGPFPATDSKSEDLAVPPPKKRDKKGGE